MMPSIPKPHMDELQIQVSKPSTLRKKVKGMPEWGHEFTTSKTLAINLITKWVAINGSESGWYGITDHFHNTIKTETKCCKNRFIQWRMGLWLGYR